MGKVRRIGIARELNVAGGVDAQLTNHLWMTWMTIGFKNEELAWRARAEGLASETPANYLTAEHQPSLVGVAAASHALDGLYGELRDIIAIPRRVREAWAKKKPARRTVILDTLRCGFDVGRKQKEWSEEFKWLFKARDFTLHHRPTPTGGSPHPLIPGSVASLEVATYNAEACTRAVDLLVDVLVECSSNPKPTTQEWVGSAHVAKRLKARGEHRELGDGE